MKTGKLLSSLTYDEDVITVLHDYSCKLHRISDIAQYFFDKGTIEEDLRVLPEGDHVIVSIHCPPSSCNLDVCADGHCVGSLSVFKWLSNHNTALCLCGHIHESPDFGGNTIAFVGNNLVIQPGDKRFVRIRIDDDKPLSYEIIQYGR